MKVIRGLTCDEIPLIRPCLEGLAAYHNHVAKAFRGIYPTMPIDTHLMHMRDHVANDTALLLGLFRTDGTLGGFGMASYEDGYGEIDYLYLCKELRRGGYGGKILEKLLAYLKAKNVGFVDLQLVMGNPSKSFYEKHGFRPRSEIMSMRF